MSCIQATSCQLTVIPKARYHARCVSRSQAKFSRPQINVSKLSLAIVPLPTKFHQHGPVCVFGGKGKSGNANEGSLWKALEKAMGKFKKEPSIEEQLKQQIAKNEFYEDGGNTGGGGGGFGGGGGGDSGESEDEGFSGIVGEVLQVMFATLGFVFLYIFIIESEDITRLAKDFIKFIFTGKKSIRLGRALNGLSVFFKQFSKKPEVDEYWLEKEILNTSTWYDGPNKYKRMIKSHLGSRSIDFDDINDDDDDDDDDDEGSRSEDNDDDYR